MKTSRKIFILVITIIMLVTPLAARENNSIAIGVQGGFLATGVVVDIPLGPLSVNAGLNYPAGWLYIRTLSDTNEDIDNLLDPFFVLTADVTSPIPVGENFNLKVGANSLAFTDFSNGLFGVAGFVLKGEYWIPNKDRALFVNLNVPLMLYVVGPETPFNAVFSPWLPLAGLLTTTAGVLWSL